MQGQLPTAKSGLAPGERMWIGEYGWGGDSPAAQEPLSRSYIQRLLNWQGSAGALRYILFWEIYNNQASNGTNFYLISPSDTPAPCYYLLQRFLNKARLLVAQFNETNGSLPNDAQFAALTSPRLNSPLPPPVNLTVANLGARLITPSNTVVSGSLAQGVYGDDEATLWLYWGLRDGGTNPQSWANSQWIGVNTNFNPKTYSLSLSNLLPQTNYYYRFYATNSATNAWAPSSARFSTTSLNPADFASSLQVVFSGYSDMDGLFLGAGTAVNTFGLTNVLILGAFLNPTFQFNGKMDEARIQSGAASSHGLWTTWATAAANATLQNYSRVAQQFPDRQTSSVPDGIVLSWAGSGVGFTLYSTTNLAPPTLWLAATNPPVLLGGQWQVNLPTNSSTARYYRLQSA